MRRRVNVKQPTSKGVGSLHSLIYGEYLPFFYPELFETRKVRQKKEYTYDVAEKR